MIARAVGLVLAALVVAGCMRISVVGVHCKKTELGLNQWEFYTYIECKPGHVDTIIGDPALALPALYPDPTEAGEAAPPAP